ncbi:Prolyl tripeptidyl peptidase [subsurface metagenome]
MAGMKSEKTEVWVYSIEEHSLVRIQTEGDPEQYHTNLSWSPDAEKIYIQHLNRDQDTMVMKSYRVDTGEMTDVLFTEYDDKYVEPLNPVVFSGKSQGDFFYQSNRNGYNHIYYYNANKDTLERITRGTWEVTEFLGFDTTECYVYFVATKDSSLERHCYRIDRKSDSITRLTANQGTHDVLFNKNMTHFIDKYSNYIVSNKISVCKNNGKVVQELLDSENPVAGYKLGKVEIGTMLAADDNTELYYRLVKPADFDTSLQYPVLIYVYGGPHVQLITNSWMDRIDYFQQYMAQKGFVSFTLDCRGSGNRGRDFEDVIHRQLGVPQLDDHMVGLAFLKSLPYVDTTRIGVHGWSFGGYMTISMMLSFPGSFKVGVAGGPVIDWKYYEIMYGERYMDTPDENPLGYELTNLTNYAKDLKGDLLIIHGAIDPVVVWQHSLVFLQACIENGVYADYFIYPLHEHNVRGKDRVHLTTLISEYFLERL